MKTMTALVTGALLATVAACSNDSSDEQTWAPTFLIEQCSPVDPHCQLAEPPHLDERPEPGAQ